MARILSISDIHENVGVIKEIINTVSFDALFLCGDIVELRSIEFRDLILGIERKMLIIGGNHDCIQCYRRIASKRDNIVFMYRGTVEMEIDNELFTVLCLSGIYSRRKRDMFHYTDRDILKVLRKVIQDCCDMDIIVTHTPPYRMADYLPKGGRGGLKQLLVFRDALKPKYWISGHTHVLACERVDGTIAINCGLGYIGDLCLIDTKRENIMLGRLVSKEISIEEDPVWDFLRHIRSTDSYMRVLAESSKML